MKLATKISAGYLVLIGLMLLALVYQASIIFTLSSASEQLSHVNFKAAHLTYELRQDISLIEEFTQKFFVSKDKDFREEMKRRKSEFKQDLDRLGDLSLSKAEAGKVQELQEAWDDYSKNTHTPVAEADWPPLEDKLLGAHLKHLKGLDELAGEFIQVIEDSILITVTRASVASRQADTHSLIAVGLAVVLGLAICVPIIRSISSRLERLTQGTREIAKGNFEYRLYQDGSDEFGQLAVDFNSMARRLSELDRMKKDFFSYVSHELKTPLGSIHETIRLLLDRIPGPLEEKQERLLKLNLRSAERLSAMIGNLLDMSRIEAGMMQYAFGNHDLVTLAERTVAEFEPKLREKEVLIRTSFPEEGVRVRCDEIRLRQVIENLLDNALKFSPRGSSIGLAIHDADEVSEIRKQGERNGAFVTLDVSDRGPGVPDRYKQSIFDQFSQINGSKKGKGQGTGLGLAICRNIVDSHEGRIWARDHSGGGAVFSVLLSRVPQSS